MNYRDGTKQDYPAIAEFIKSQDYFNEIDPETLGGQWLIAEHEGKIYATVWCFVQAPHAYIDYWAGSGITGARIGLIAEYRLRKSGIRYMRGVIRQSNTSAHRLATEGIGMLSGANFYLVFKELIDGRTENHTDDNASRSVGAGVENTQAAGTGSTEGG
jgi:hypothetical protein